MTTFDRDELVRDHLPMAERMARKKKRGLPRHVDLDDLVAAAYLGLVESAANYDPATGVPFPGFAFFRVLGSIQDHLRKLGVGSRGGRIRNLLQFELDDRGRGGESLLEARQSPGFDEITDGVPPAGKDLLRLYYLEGLKLREIGERLGVGEARVSQLLSKYRDQIKEAA